MTMDAGRPQTTSLVARAGLGSKKRTDGLGVLTKLRREAKVVSRKCDDSQADQS